MVQARAGQDLPNHRGRFAMSLRREMADAVHGYVREAQPPCPVEGNEVDGPGALGRARREESIEPG